MCALRIACLLSANDAVIYPLFTLKQFTTMCEVAENRVSTLQVRVHDTLPCHGWCVGCELMPQVMEVCQGVEYKIDTWWRGILIYWSSKCSFCKVTGGGAFHCLLISTLVHHSSQIPSGPSLTHCLVCSSPCGGIVSHTYHLICSWNSFEFITAKAKQRIPNI